MSITIPTQYLDLISPVEVESRLFLKKVQELKITNEQTYFAGAKLKKEVTSFVNSGDKKRLEITAPARALVEAINDKAKSVLTPAIEAKELIIKEILAYEAMLEAQRQAEAKRITEINKIFLLAETKTTVELNQEIKSKVESYFQNLPITDQEIPEIKQACFSLIERINQKILLLQEQEAQRIEAKRLAKIKARQDKEALKLATKQAELDKIKRDQEAKERRLKDEEIKQKLADEKLQADKIANFKPSTGMLTYTKFEIIDPSLVPRELCSPDSVLINQAIKNGKTEISGLRIYQEKN